MKKLAFGLAVFGLMFPSFVFAQSSQAPAYDGVSTGRSSAVGNTSCFDYYHFGSVEADISSNVGQTVPGAEIAFSGKVKNANEYPVVNGTVYIKIFRKDQEVFSQANGHRVVDQFALPTKFTLPAQGEKDVAFNWTVPANAPGGEYYAATFFATENRYNLLGLSFTDDVVGNIASFTVTSSAEPLQAEFSKNGTTLNGKIHNYVSSPRHFGKDEPVILKANLVNSTGVAKVVPIIWKTYTWDALRAENQTAETTEFVELQPNETKELAYTIQPANTAVQQVVAEARDGSLKSFLNVRLVRDGVPETRINFPGLLKFPLVAGEEETLFVCAHSTNENTVPNNVLTLTLRDEAGNLIHQYSFAGDIAGAMSGWKESFTPEKFYSNVVLSATLERDGQIVEEVNVTYNCRDIDPNLCQEPKKSFWGDWMNNGKGLMIGIIALLLILAVVAIVISRVRASRRPQFGIFLLGFLVLSSFTIFSDAPKAEAASTQFTKTETGKFLYRWGTRGNPTGAGLGWADGLDDVNITITYEADVYNADTNQLLNSAASVPVNTRLRFEPNEESGRSTNISWSGTGYSSDSPYGHFIANAGPPTGATEITCEADDRANEQTGEWTAYAPLSIAPPVVTVQHSGTAQLQCDATGRNCTAKSAGSIDTSFIFASTYGKFYHRYYDGRVCGSFDTWGGCLNPTTPGCYGNNHPMRLAPRSLPASLNACYDASYGADKDDTCGREGNDIGSEYRLSVPQKTITHTLTVVDGNNAPGTPTLSCTTNGVTGMSYPYTATATDPDGDTLKYGFDWNKDGNVDQWMPASGFVASGTPQTANYSWASAGTYDIQVRAQDSNGAISGWATCSTTITVPTSGVCGAANGVAVTSTPTQYLCSTGTATTVTGTGPWNWTCQGSDAGATTDDVSCSAPKNTVEPGVCGPAAGQQYASTPTTDLCSTGTASAVTKGGLNNWYSWTCAGSGGGASATCNAYETGPKCSIDLKINNQDANLTNVAYKSNLAMSWAVQNATRVTGSGVNFSGSKVAINGTNTENIQATADSDYYATCSSATGPVTDGPINVTVQKSLTVCKNSCGSNVTRGRGGALSTLDMSKNSIETWYACYGPSTDCRGSAANQVSATWSEQGGNNAVAISATNGISTNVSANNPGTERVSATSSAQTANIDVSVRCEAPSKEQLCSSDPRYGELCLSDTFNVSTTNSCGETISYDCNGTKSCDFNWKEVAP